MSDQQYQSYLLRLWRNNPDSSWHGSLQSTASGEKYTFADLHSLFRFLMSELGVAGAIDDPADLAAWLATQRIEETVSEQPTFTKESDQ